MRLDGNNLTRERFQGEIDSAPQGEELNLFREFAGPVVLKRELEIDGKSSEIADGHDRRAVIWALKGPVVSIASPGVALRNLRIEVTADQPQTSNNEDCALVVKSGVSVSLENVEVRGAVVGLDTEEGQWWYPYALDLGLLAHSQDYDLLLRLCVPVSCRISSGISGLEVWPCALSPGQNELHLRLSALPKKTWLNGHLSLTTALLRRRITVTGRVCDNTADPSHAVTALGTVVWEPADWETPPTAGEQDSHVATTPATPQSPRIKRGRKKAIVAPGEQSESGRSTEVAKPLVTTPAAHPVPAEVPQSKSSRIAKVPPAPPAVEAAGSPEPQLPVEQTPGSGKGSKRIERVSIPSQPKSKPAKFVLTATAKPREGGRVQGTGEYARGIGVSIRAKENPKWRFERWSGDFVGKDNPASLLMDADKRITAHFDKTSFVVTAGAEPREGGKVQGAGEYPNGGYAQLKADPNSYWRFRQWSGDLAGADNPASVRIDADKKITAQFVKLRNFVLAAETKSGRGGTVEGAARYDEGQIALIKAVAKSGWRFDHWSGDVAGAVNPTPVTMAGDKAVVAHFVREGKFMQRVLAAAESPTVVLPFCTGMTLLDLLWVWRKGVEATVGVSGIAIVAGTAFAFSVGALFRRLFRDD